METIKITLSQVMGSIEALNELISVPMPAVTAFNVRKIASAVEEERKTISETIQGRRESLLEDDKNPSEEDITTLNKEIEELLSSEVELKANKINITDLGAANIKPRTLMALDWLIVG